MKNNKKTPMKSTKWGVQEGQGVRRPYPYLSEVDRLLPKGPLLKKIKAVIKKKNMRANSKQYRAYMQETIT